jgi:alpha-methylacyl-CoA racemase
MGEGPLGHIKVIEMAGVGPAPFCAMLFADLGAEVLKVDRPKPADLGVAREPRFNLLNRGRRSVALDLKIPEGVACALRLIEKADVLIEGFRPGVMERLGLGPDVCLGRNPRLVYGRVTGWGQEGPLAKAAGHDINYIALSGVLHAIGPPERPVPPLNIVGDFGGGALYLAFGITAALLDARRSGLGQVVDAAMVDGSASLMTMHYGLLAQGVWQDERGVNLLDGGAPWYAVYETSDGKCLAVGAIEERFYEELVQGLGLGKENLPPRFDRARWPELREKFATAIKAKTSDEWTKIFAGSDANTAPVLSMREAIAHAHNVARQTFVAVDGVIQPGPAPRFSRTPGKIQSPPARPGEHTEQALADWGFPAGEIAALKAKGVLGRA